MHRTITAMKRREKTADDGQRGTRRGGTGDRYTHHGSFGLLLVALTGPPRRLDIVPTYLREACARNITAATSLIAMQMRREKDLKIDLPRLLLG
ncbi:hypothetical protein THAOC_37285 [Thalassiosira oceanica]|uniref:Uncharacterized protein n=1 Tax=Thalassiosira oceanica TaxID=159749 RepID=K0R6I9_THAOC|nr:hypothetical protein THAOC_37285 [Thalassiosira oceanica]|eukprot:EJK44196.1 hypothetical protein THAOC_37285 [Thalassiosira oceanica]